MAEEIVNMTGSSAELIGSTMTVINLNRKLDIWNPHNGNIKTLHDGIQQQILLIMTTNKCFDTLLYFYVDCVLYNFQPSLMHLMLKWIML